MKIASKIVFISLMLGIVTTSCEKKTCYNEIPQMDYAQFYQSVEDSVYYNLVFSFSDCDGDIGMNNTATIKDENGDIQSNNFFIDLYHLDNGNWKLHDYGAAQGLDSKIPNLGNSEVNPILDGEIEKKLHPAFSLESYDTIRFNSRILDNAGHYSEWVETPIFVILQ